MFKILCLSLILVSQSSAGFSDYLPGKWVSRIMGPKKTTTKPTISIDGLLEVTTELALLNDQRQNVRVQTNSNELMKLRTQINEIDRELESLSLQIHQRLEDIRRDYLGLRNDLKRRIDARSTDKKDAQIRLKQQKILIDFVSSWSKRYGHLVKNLFDSKNKLLGDFNESLLKQYKDTERALAETNGRLLENWKKEISDPQIVKAVNEIQRLIIDRGNLLTKLQQALKPTAQAVSLNPFEKLSSAIKQANCPLITSMGTANNDNLRHCFVRGLKNSQLSHSDACRPILVSSTNSSQQIIDPSRPLEMYITCAKEVKGLKVTPVTNDSSPLAIVIRLAENEKILHDLSKDKESKRVKFSAATNVHSAENENLETGQAEYQNKMAAIRLKLQMLDESLVAIQAAAQQQLNKLLDKNYIPEVDNNEIADAMMKEGGADLAEEIITRMVQDSLKDKAVDFAKTFLKQRFGESTYFYEFNPKQIQSSLRIVIDKTSRDISLIKQFVNSQIYSAQLDAALKRLHSKYPFLEIDTDSGVLKRALAKAKSYFYGPISKPVLQESTFDQKGRVHASIQEIGRAQADIRSIEQTESIILKRTMTDIHQLKCPYIKDFNTLTPPSIDKCAQREINKRPPQEVSHYPACYPWSTQGPLGCVSALQTGRKVPDDVQLGVLVNKIRDGLVAQEILRTAGTAAREANSRINHLNDLAPQLHQAIEDFQSFQDKWLADRRAKLQMLYARHAVAQDEYTRLNIDLQKIQGSWMQYLQAISQLDGYTARFALLITHIAAQTTPLNNPNLAQDVQKAQRLTDNLQDGIKKLEDMINNFDAHIRYQRDARVLHDRLNSLKEVLFATNTRLNELLSNADTSVTTLEDAFKSLDCKWFVNMGAGQRGLNQCLAAFIDKIHQLGTILNKPACTKIDLTSHYIQNDLDTCSIRPQSSTGIDEGDVVRGAQIIRGMKIDDAGAMINKLMIEGGYSKDKARQILKEMMIL